MRSLDRMLIGCGLAGALFIWWHDQAWRTAPDDALPLLVALPAFVWLSRPLVMSESPLKLHRPSLALGGLLALAGLISGINLLLVLGWTAAVWAWLRSRLADSSRARCARLLPLLILAFPWLTLDFPSLAWWCRLSAAWCAEVAFQGLGFAVHREGTQLLVAHLPFDVEPACSGIKALQAMLIAGTVLCFLQNGASRTYWIGLAVLPVAAWFSNVVRVVAIMAATLSFGPGVAHGWLHSAAGLMVILGTFSLVWFALELLRKRMAPAATS